MAGSSTDKETQREATKMRNDCIAKLKRSTRNRESYDEIAELEAVLRRAYITKELQAQIAERETERYIEDVRKQQAAKLMQLEQQVALEDDVRRRAEDLQKSVDYRRSLEEQMTRKVEERKIILEEARREREILEEVDKTREEYERSKSLEMKNELAESMRRECLILQEMREIRRQEEQETEAKKLQKDLEYREEIDRRAREVKILGEEQAVKRERIVCEIAGMILDVETQKRERETLMAELVAEDIKRELLIKEKEEAVRRRRMKEELAADLKEQIIFTEQCKLRFVEQDRMFAEEIMRKIMEDERTARLTADARRRLQLQYREELNRLIVERRRIREKEIAKMEEAAEEEKKRARIRMDRMREERKRLLEEHALNVAGFINKGALSREEQEIVAKLMKNVHDTTGVN